MTSIQGNPVHDPIQVSAAIGVHVFTKVAVVDAVLEFPHLNLDIENEYD